MWFLEPRRLCRCRSRSRDLNLRRNEPCPKSTLSNALIPVITLLALPRIKGGWIGLMYALGVSDRDARVHTADAAD